MLIRHHFCICYHVSKITFTPTDFFWTTRPQFQVQSQVDVSGRDGRPVPWRKGRHSRSLQLQIEHQTLQHPLQRRHPREARSSCQEQWPPPPPPLTNPSPRSQQIGESCQDQIPVHKGWQARQGGRVRPWPSECRHSVRLQLFC